MVTNLDRQRQYYREKLGISIGMPCPHKSAPERYISNILHHEDTHEIREIQTWNNIGQISTVYWSGNNLLNLLEQIKNGRKHK